MGVTPVERLREDAAAARSCEREARAIESLTAERAPDVAANLQGLTSLLVDIAEFLEAKLPSEGASEDAANPGRVAAGSAASSRRSAGSGPVGSRAEAQEVAQDTMIKAYLRWRKVQYHARPWVCRVAVNGSLGKPMRYLTLLLRREWWWFSAEAILHPSSTSWNLL